ncbi:MAG: excinuclease ABC subunit A [Pedosphaera sp.]|nr:excinuclease ABC subunit A [Pedosphaera sp.]
MPKPTPVIRLRGVRHNNLKNFDLDLPTGKLVVITGLSGSGKSSLAFDTLYAEGQRRYVETFSPYARQFFDRMDKPQVDKIEGIPPAIAIEQRNSVKSTRSTVGTMTEICDHMKVAWAHLSQLHCRNCGQPVRKESPQQIWELIRSTDDQSSVVRDRFSPRSETQLHEVLVTFELPLSEKLSLSDSLALISKQGYQRLLVRSLVGGIVEDGFALREAVMPYGSAKTQTGRELTITRIEDAAAALAGGNQGLLTVIQDRIRLLPQNRARFVEACEQAYHFGKGRLLIFPVEQRKGRSDGASIGLPRRFSRGLHCAACDIEYREPSPALFSFNHPVGACSTCKGFGRTITIDYDLAIPDRSLSLAQGAVKPWQTETGAECQTDLKKFCRHQSIPMDVPFRELKPELQDWVIQGDPEYGKDDEHQWPRAWYGVKGYFRWLESKAYKMHVRVLLSRYRAYTTCSDCKGKRLKPEALLFKVSTAANRSKNASSSKAAPAVSELTLSDFYQLSVRSALQLIQALISRHGARKPNDPLSLVLEEVRSRLSYLEEVGLGYLTLDRSTRSLSGGETERVNLTTCLGSRLVNTLFVLDEPSVGLHPRDTAKLVGILGRLRDAGNTLVVVEHEAAVMRAADQIVDLGPGHGESGGEIVFQGSFRDVLKSATSITGQYLSGRKRIEIPQRRPVNGASARLVLSHASLHNLKNITVEIPLGRLVCVTGVSGSGKTTLVREVLMPLLTSKLAGPSITGSSRSGESEDETTPEAKIDSSIRTVRSAELRGWESLGRVVMVDQSALGRTPRSNPAVYTGAFEDIRELFAQSEAARQRGLSASAFSFNSSQGQCETCRGAGFEKIEMQFLSDVFIRCPECNGRRYRQHILEITIRNGGSEEEERSIADLLDATVDEAVHFLHSFAASRPAQRAASSLTLLQEVGLGYLRLGQPINTLSGGESQRLKLVSHLVEFRHAERTDVKPTLFLFDEPTTGLHFDDVRVLLQVFQRLVDAGHTVLIIEHNVDVIKCADWLIDLGPEAGEQGGELVVSGTPDDVTAAPHSHTGAALRCA